MPITAREPFTSFPGATIRGPIAPVGGYAYITDATLGNSIQQAACIQVQATADFAVEVVGPIGHFELDPPYSAYPGPGPSSASANQIVLIRGRWQAIRVATTGNVYVMIDSDLRSYGGMG